MKVLRKIVLAEFEDTRIVKMVIDAQHVAGRVLPGQFVTVMVNHMAERIPLTVVEQDHESISLIFQEIGYSTKLLGQMDVGHKIFSVAGPLGHASEIKSYGKVVVIGGGVGVAEIFPVVKALRDCGNHVETVLGFRTSGLSFLVDELREVSSRTHVMTDDGSLGEQGFTTAKLSELVAHNDVDCVYAVGPVVMMQKVIEITAPLKIKTLVSLNATILDGTGMCGCCRVKIGDEVKFSCIDGPEFDASLVDWAELLMRSRMYIAEEQHICKLKGQA